MTTTIEPIADTAATLTLDSVTIEIIPDDAADTSMPGEYTDDPAPWNIDRREGEYIHDLKRTCPKCSAPGRDFDSTVHSGTGWTCDCGANESADDCACNIEYACLACHYLFESAWEPRDSRATRESLYFKPYAGGETPGSEEYRTYGMQDYKRMECLAHGDWQFIGICAEAQVSRPIGDGCRRLQTLTSGGLWGIESDSDRAYLVDVAQEQCLDLRAHLAAFGVPLDIFQTLADEAINNMD